MLTSIGKDVVGRCWSKSTLISLIKARHSGAVPYVVIRIQLALFSKWLGVEALYEARFGAAIIDGTAASTVGGCVE